MKNIIKYIALSFFCLAIGLPTAMAGNEDRVGQAGATELLINPWARSTGWAGANSAGTQGIEAQYLNVAGMAFTTKTEMIFTQTQWFQGSGATISSFGLSQKIGETSVIGISVTSMGVGDIDVTTVDLPEGGSGTFSPNLLIIGASFSKAFSNSIYAGVTFKIINESVANMKASGFAIDAGIQYITGKRKNLKFGMTLKNWGTRMKFSGDGLSFSTDIFGQDYSMTVEQRTAEYELPSLIRIGLSYDFYLNESNIVTLAGTFTSNSFTDDQYALGLQYDWKHILQVRAGYEYTEDCWNVDRQTAYTGPACGMSVQIPLSKENNSIFSLDYSYRFTAYWLGTHSFGARINL